MATNGRKPERDNFYLSEYFDWRPPKPSRKIERINGILKRLGVFPRLMPPKFSGLMTNVEQRMNMYHFVSQVLVHEIPGELVEVGCNSGESSVLITKILGEFDPSKKLHVYDSFEGLPDRAPQ